MGQKARAPARREAEPRGETKVLVEELAERMVRGESGEKLLQALKEHSKRKQWKDNTFVNAVTKVRNAYFQKMGTRATPELEAGLRKMRALLKSGLEPPQCRAEVQEFVEEMSLKDRYLLQRHRAEHCIGNQAVNEVYRQMKVVPDNFAAFAPDPSSLRQRRTRSKQLILLRACRAPRISRMSMAMNYF